MINRREMLAISGGMLLSAGSFGKLLAADTRPIYGGWLDIESARQEFIDNNRTPYFSQLAGDIKGSGKNKQVLLWKFFEKITKAPFSPRFQDIGDCVSQGSALGVDTLTTVQIGLLGKNEEWKGPCSTESIYGGGRVEVGKGKIKRFDGMTGAWAGEWVRDYGILLRGVYGDIDLTKYRPDLARLWGRNGVPENLKKLAKPHPVKTVTLVEGFDQAADSIANGYPVLVCSNVGYVDRTDDEGFLSRGKKPWNHGMLIWGIDTISKRQGGCIANSWGTNWISGPQHKLGTPAGCFWADAKNIDAMLKQEDSFAFSNYIGYPRRDLDYRLW